MHINLSIIQASRNFSIHAQGVFYNKSNEGLPYNDGTSDSAKNDDMVAPNSAVLYTWTVPDHLAPTDQDPDCLTMVYTSAVDPIKDVYSGRNFVTKFLVNFVKLYMYACKI